MEEVTYMSDYLAVQLLSMAQKCECDFAECLESCKKDGDDFVKIDERPVFERLLGSRINSLVLSLTAFETYLGYYSARTASRLETEFPGISLSDYLEKLDLLMLLKDLPTRATRRHEMIMVEHGRHSLTRFLTSERLGLEDKLLYWPLIRSGELMNQKDGNVKKLNKLIGLRQELMSPAMEVTHEMRPAATTAEIMDVFLRHPVVDNLTPGKSCSDQYVISPYFEMHFIWELLHSYPARAVQEAIQYLHKQAGDDQHFIAAIRQARLVDDAGEPITEPTHKFVLDIDLGN